MYCERQHIYIINLEFFKFIHKMFGNKEKTLTFASETI